MTEPDTSGARRAAIATAELVPGQVARLLQRSPAFAALAEVQRVRIESSMTALVAYMADPHGLTGLELSTCGAILSRAIAVPDPLCEASPAVFSGKLCVELEPGFVQAWGRDPDALVATLDFAQFVAGLVEGVFEAIVDASIRQMEAYAELLDQVARSVEQFVEDEASADHARACLVREFPDLFERADQDPADECDREEGTTLPLQRCPHGGDADQALIELCSAIGMREPIIDLADPDQEHRLVTAARLHIGRVRRWIVAVTLADGIARIPSAGPAPDGG